MHDSAAHALSIPMARFGAKPLLTSKFPAVIGTHGIGENHKKRLIQSVFRHCGNGSGS